MTRPTNSIELSTGVTLQYVEQGDRSGVPLVLLHGYSDSLRSFELLLPQLPASLHAFALTQRGHGDADRPAGGYGPEDHAADVLAFMDAVGLEAAVIAGALRWQLLPTLGASRARRERGIGLRATREPPRASSDHARRIEPVDESRPSGSPPKRQASSGGLIDDCDEAVPQSHGNHEADQEHPARRTSSALARQPGGSSPSG